MSEGGRAGRRGRGKEWNLYVRPTRHISEISLSGKSIVLVYWQPNVARNTQEKIYKRKHKEAWSRAGADNSEMVQL